MIRLIVCIVLVVSIMLGVGMALRQRVAPDATAPAEAEPPKPVAPEPPPRWERFYVSYRVSLLHDNWTGREFLTAIDGAFIEVQPRAQAVRP